MIWPVVLTYLDVIKLLPLTNNLCVGCRTLSKSEPPLQFLLPFHIPPGVPGIVLHMCSFPVSQRYVGSLPEFLYTFLISKIAHQISGWATPHPNRNCNFWLAKWRFILIISILIWPILVGKDMGFHSSPLTEFYSDIKCGSFPDQSKADKLPFLSTKLGNEVQKQFQIRMPQLLTIITCNCINFQEEMLLNVLSSIG